MTVTRECWRTEDRRRWFLIPAGERQVEGDLTIRSVTGDRALVDRAWAARFETSEEEGRAWAKGELGAALGELKQGIDAGLAGIRRQLDGAKCTPVAENNAIAPEAVPTLLALLKSLPQIIGNSLSGQPERVAAAKDSAAEGERRLREAGIDLGDRLAAFPSRLAGLRGDFTNRKAGEPPAEP